MKSSLCLAVLISVVLLLCSCTSHAITPQPTFTPIMPIVSPQADCESFITPLLLDMLLEGGIVLDGSYFDSASYIMRFSPEENIILANNGDNFIGEFSISPNGEWFFYTMHEVDSQGALTNGILVIMNADGQFINSLMMEEDWWGVTWLNDRLLQISRREPGEITASPDASLLTLDPFTGEIQDLFNSFADLWYLDILHWGDYSLSRAAYSPDLSRVAYPVLDEDRSIKLLDAYTGQILAAVPSLDWGRDPAWSPDSRHFAFVTATSAGEELFLLDENGTLTQATHLSDTGSDIRIVSPTWSPDSRQLAFGIVIHDDANGFQEHLAVLELDTLNMQEYCHVSGYDRQFAPFWSPDGNYLLFGYFNQPDGIHSRVIVLDPSSGATYLTAENYLPAGWVK